MNDIPILSKPGDWTDPALLAWEERQRRIKYGIPHPNNTFAEKFTNFWHWLLRLD